MKKAKFIKDNGRQQREITFEDERVNLPIMDIESDEVFTPIVQQDVTMEHPFVSDLSSTNVETPRVQVPLRRSTGERRKVIPDDYIVYLQEHEFDIGLEDDPCSFSQANSVLIPKSGWKP